MRSWDLLQPKKPAETELKQIVEELEKHYSPKPSEIVERFKFHSRNRKEGEGVAAHVARLCKLIEHCNFGETLEDTLWDRLVCGISNDNIQWRLLAEPELKFQKAIKLALAMELASKARGGFEHESRSDPQQSTPSQHQRAEGSHYPKMSSQWRETRSIFLSISRCTVFQLQKERAFSKNVPWWQENDDRRNSWAGKTLQQAREREKAVNAFSQGLDQWRRCVHSDYVPHTNGKQGKICLSGHRTLWRTT